MRVLRFLAPALLLALAFGPVRGAASLTQRIEPTDVSVGDEVTVTISVLNGGGADVQLPRVDGLELQGTSTATQITFTNGALSSSVSQIFTLMPDRAGDLTIPAFDVHVSGGQVLHAHEMKIHVVAGSNNVPAPANSPFPQAPAQPQFPGNGPVVMPSAPDDQNNATPNNPTDQSATSVQPPMGSDGRPVKVFMVIAPETTDAYIGQTIPMRIDFYIRVDSLAQQDSLPTIKGIDFLMNDLSVRPEEDEVNVGNETYHRETWRTAISAPKNGDFPLQMERDTYWTKDARGVFSDPLGNFFGPRPQLAHGNVPSNQLVMHIHALPDEGKPADFTGAIGQFQVAGNASPTTVNVGEPVYIDFSITGQGNFDHVRCPALTPDPAWKTYVPSSKVNYDQGDESRTHGDKIFRQAVIPQKNGTLSLPSADFSYFDPTTKKYVVLPINLPAVTVTGTPEAAAPAPVVADNTGTSSTATAAADNSDLSPNRLEFGSLRTDLTPSFLHPWYWLAQGVALLVVILSLPFLLLRSRRRQDNARAERALRRRSLHELEQAMSLAVQQQDAAAFFSAARQALQLQWGAAWGLRPEAVTLPVMAEHDPELAARLAPLFGLADEAMYSGRTTQVVDLAAWEQQVRDELRQLQPV
jgi:oxygen tolerance protein BatD